MSAPLLRPMRPADRGHIVTSWVASYATSADAETVRDAQSVHPIMGAYAVALDGRVKRRGEPSLYHALQRVLVDQLLPRCAVMVACLDDDEDVIVGWRALEGTLLHYVCVKPDFQRMGTGKLLVADLLDRPLTLTHWSEVCHSIRLPPRWRYDGKALKGALAA